MTLLPCEQCGYIGPHGKLETDCILEHPEHTQRYVGLLCRRHYHWIEQTLTQITELFSLRGSVLLVGTGSAEGRNATRDGSPVPGRIDVMAITDKRMRNSLDVRMTYEANYNPAHGRYEDNGDTTIDVLGTLGSWALVVEEETGDPIPIMNTSRLGKATFTEIVLHLHAHRHWIARAAWVDDYMAELGDVHHALAVATGGGMWPQSIGPCPNCGTKLYNTIGIDIVACRKCKSSWEGVHLARLRYILEPAT